MGNRNSYPNPSPTDITPCRQGSRNYPFALLLSLVHEADGESIKCVPTTAVINKQTLTEDVEAISISCSIPLFTTFLEWKFTAA